jgi:hypothetical protein
MTGFFLKISLEYSMSRPIRNFLLQTELRPYPKNVPTFFFYRRFEDVEAQKGHEKVPATCTRFLLKITQLWGEGWMEGGKAGLEHLYRLSARVRLPRLGCGWMTGRAATTQSLPYCRPRLVHSFC